MTGEVLFGDTDRFAVGLRPRLVDGELFDVFVDLWVAGERLGDPDDPFMVGSIALGFGDVVRSAPVRHCLPFVDMDAAQIIEDVWRRTFGSSDAGRDAIEASTAAHRYVLSEASLSLLDHGWRVVGIRYSRDERIPWDRGPGTDVHDVRVRAKLVDRTIADLLAWCDARPPRPS